MQKVTSLLFVMKNKQKFWEAEKLKNKSIKFRKITSWKPPLKNGSILFFWLDPFYNLPSTV